MGRASHDGLWAMQERGTLAAPMLYELAKRLKDAGRSAAEIRAELMKVGATKQECDVLLGSLGLSTQPMTAAPELLAKTSRIASSRWLLLLVLVGVLVVLTPVVWLAYTLVHAFSVGR